jgi:hypothetical protein
MPETNPPRSTAQPAAPPSHQRAASIRERTEQLKRKVDDLSEMFERIERTLAETRDHVDDGRD